MKTLLTLNLKKITALVPLFALVATLVSSSAPALAHNYSDGYYNNGYYNDYRRNDGRFLGNHPYARKAVLVGGAGAAVGALVAPDGRRGGGAIKGALLGAGAGLGYEYLRRKGLF